MEASIATIHPGLGSETPAQPGTLRRQRNARSCSNTPSAGLWANNGSITSIHLVVGFRTPRPGLPILAEELISAAVAMLAAAAIGDLNSLTRKNQHQNQQVTP